MGVTMTVAVMMTIMKRYSMKDLDIDAIMLGSLTWV